MRCAARLRPTLRRRRCRKTLRRPNNTFHVDVLTMIAPPSVSILSNLLNGAAALADSAVQLQSALDPAGVQAHSISKLWWGFFWLTAAVYLLVILFMFIAIGRRRRKAVDSAPELPIVTPDKMGEWRMSLTVGSAT